MILRLWQRQRGYGGSSVVLPLAGGLLEQPSYLINWFGLADVIWSRLEEAARARERARRGG